VAWQEGFRDFSVSSVLNQVDQSGATPHVLQEDRDLTRAAWGGHMRGAQVLSLRPEAGTGGGGAD
jgi:hypothetical protein